MHATGEDVNQTNKDGVTALLMAASNGYLDICKLLVSLKADVNHQAKNGVTALGMALCSMVTSKYVSFSSPPWLT